MGPAPRPALPDIRFTSRAASLLPGLPPIPTQRCDSELFTASRLVLACDWIALSAFVWEHVWTDTLKGGRFVTGTLAPPDGTARFARAVTTTRTQLERHTTTCHIRISCLIHCFFCTFSHCSYIPSLPTYITYSMTLTTWFSIAYLTITLTTFCNLAPLYDGTSRLERGLLTIMGV